jgi:hypothetical protein
MPSEQLDGWSGTLPFRPSLGWRGRSLAAAIGFALALGAAQIATAEVVRDPLGIVAVSTAGEPTTSGGRLPGPFDNSSHALIEVAANGGDSNGVVSLATNGNASGAVAASNGGAASGGQIAVSNDGSCDGNVAVCNGGPSSGLAGISNGGDSSSLVGISTTGNTTQGFVGVSPTGNSQAYLIAISGTGDARSDVVACLSVAGDCYGAARLAVAPLGTAHG